MMPKVLLESLRSLRRQPLFLSVTVLILGVGLAGVATAFSFVHTMVLKPLPYEEPDRLVQIWGSNPEEGHDKVNVSPDDVRFFADNVDKLSGVTSFIETNQTLTQGSEAMSLKVAVVTPSYFSVLGVEPRVGRAFREEEGVPGNHRVALISHGLAQRRYGGEAAVGETLTLDGTVYEVVGIVPHGFEHASRDMDGEPDVYRPLAYASDPDNRVGRWAKAVARLADGSNLAEAQAEIDPLALELESRYPATNENWSALLQPLPEAASEEVRPGLLVLLAALSFVLLVTCVTVANLLLARGADRQREFAIRAALGAKQGQLTAQIFTESLLLSLGGWLLALVLTPFGIRLLASLSPPGLPRLHQVVLEPAVALVTLGVALLTSLIFGLVPALRASRVNFNNLIKEGGGRGSSGGIHNRWVRASLVVGQVALSVVLLVVGGLLLRSFQQLTSVDPGFRAGGVVSFQISLPQSNYPQVERVRGFFRDLISDVAALPGVQSVGAVDMLPFTGRSSCDVFFLSDRPRPTEDFPCAESRNATPGYFETMGIALRRGRTFNPGDDALATPVAVINRAMAERHWPEGDPLGTQVQWASYEGERPQHTIVGIVDNVRHSGLDTQPAPEVYVPHAQDHSSGHMMVVVRGSQPPDRLVPALRDMVRRLDAALPLKDVQTMEQRIASTVWMQRLGAALIATLAAVALLLAVLGLYGVISYLVHQRSFEFGIRMALGAERGDVQRLVVLHGLKLALLGVGLGLAASLALSRVVAGLLYGVSAQDPVIFAGVAVLLTLVAILASYLPAWRASQVDPAVSLRSV